MANLCATMICIQHEDVEKLRKLEKQIDEWLKPKDKTGDDRWLGNIVINAGIRTTERGEPTFLKCRGEVNSIELIEEENQIMIDVESAWVPMLEMWKKLLEKYLPDAPIVCSTEEIGLLLFFTNDPVLVGKPADGDFKYEYMTVDECIECCER